MQVFSLFFQDDAGPVSYTHLTEALEPNGWCWQVPLIGGKLDKVFASPATLTVQKLGTLYTAHPAITCLLYTSRCV